ncbi:DUF7882 family protein [Microbacterium sp. CJ88]|uniref:DUF7882 family protein n=1 Tax=Microbacterium sp. CJ88 TaxID=3445672 RepID=UPI003F65D7A3
MGRLIYGSGTQSLDIDDRTLAHLRVVFMNKLRRRESFMFTSPPVDGLGSRTLWIAPPVPLVFHFYGSRQPALNPKWIDALMREAASPSGLRIVAEPGPGDARAT